MRQCKRLCAFAATPLLTLGLCAQAPDPAPSPDGQVTVAEGQTAKVPAHASRWDYPKEAAPGPGQQVHVVAKGDTLWDLGTKYLGNPFAWPQIWELNKWVKDPHWIYPGDPILVEPSRTTVTQQQKDQNLAPTEVAELQPDIKRVAKPVQAEYAFSFQDFIEMPYLVPGTAEEYLKKINAFKIVGQRDSSKNMMADGDVLYLSGGSNQGVKPGDRLVVTTIASRKFYHPDDKNRLHLLGDILEQSGILRVIQVYPSEAVAVVERSLDGVSKGSYAAPYLEPAAILNALRKDITSPIQTRGTVAKIIYIRSGNTLAGTGELAILDQGTKAGFNVGDVLLSARTTELDPSLKASDTTNDYLGQAIVIRASENSATCRVLRSKAEVVVGDILTH